MKLLENNTVELTDSEWVEISARLTADERSEIMGICWSGPFERTANMNFRNINAGLMFVLRWSA